MCFQELVEDAVFAFVEIIPDFNEVNHLPVPFRHGQAACPSVRECEFLGDDIQKRLFVGTRCVNQFFFHQRSKSSLLSFCAILPCVMSGSRRIIRSCDLAFGGTRGVSVSIRDRANASAALSRACWFMYLRASGVGSSGADVPPGVRCKPRRYKGDGGTSASFTPNSSRVALAFFRSSLSAIGIFSGVQPLCTHQGMYLRKMEDAMSQLPISVLMAASVQARSRQPKPVLLGTAAWRDGILQTYKQGQVLLGVNDSRVVGLADEGHVLLCCGPRGGKGVSIIVPNLCLYPGSVVVIDPKGENAMVTARRRAGGSLYCHGMGQKVRILDPMNEAGSNDDDLADLKACYNPLDLIDPRRGESINDAGRIADALIVSENSSDPFWDDAARSLLVGFILHVASSWDFLPEDRNLVTVYDLAMVGDANAAAIAKKQTSEPLSGFALLAASMKRNPAFSGAVAQAGAVLEDMEASPKMRLSVMQVLRTNLDFIRSPGMQFTLSRSDFALSELKTDPKGTSLYLCLPQRFQNPHFRWLRMMTTLMLGEMERVAHQPLCGHRVLMVLDEFAGLKRMQVIENAAAQICGFGVKMMFVVQTLAQLKDTYKDNWETLVATCSTKLFFCNDDHFTRDYISKYVGECEVIREVTSGNASVGSSSGTSSSRNHGSSSSHSKGNITTGASSGFSSGHTSGFNMSFSNGRSETLHKRALLTPDEVGRIFGQRDNPMVLVLASGQQPLMLKRILYHRNASLRGLYDANVNHPKPLALPALKIKIAEELTAQALRKAELAVSTQRWAEQCAKEAVLREAAEMKLNASARRKAFFFLFVENVVFWTWRLLIFSAIGTGIYFGFKLFGR
ncbi:MAG: type IV secretory system conjugative DNA transfer family protein [Xanthobacteraceae bacterium]|nr:type IV secretory system conjugative DNA transfer family protein [Xanthobacteraceae bacterium]